MEYKGYKEKSEYGNSCVYLMDCMDALRQTPDNYYSLAVVDPPYGIGESGKTNKSRGKLAVSKDYGNKDWDRKSPDIGYFNELIRVSKNQIIWGANHFISKIPYDSSCWIVWDKVNGDTDFADSELAWTSFKTSVRNFRFQWQGMLQGNMKEKENRIHPTQKPIALYDWIFKNYARQSIRCGIKHTEEYNHLCSTCKTPMKILDTHLGSGSSRIAAHKAGLDFVGFELDKEYFDASVKRFEQYKLQLKMF